MWRFLCVIFLTTVSAKSLNSDENQSDIYSDAELLIQEFYDTVESTINHLVVSRDMHKLVRDKRQLNNNFGGGNFGQGGSGGLGGGAGGIFGGGGNIFDGLTNVANLASLDNLAGGAASGLPFLQGIGTANNVIKSVVGLDRMRCGSRLACEYMANRGLFNRTSAFVPPTVLPTLPENAQGALNLSHPSTFRSVLGILQLMRFQEVGIYPVIEAGLWGVAHRDNNRCRNQFTKCPSTAEAFISELNSTPGGLQSMLTNSLQTIRNTLPGADSAAQGASSLLGGAPQTAANVADLSSLGSLGNFGQQTSSGLGSLAGLGGLGNNQQFGNQQFQFDTSSSGLLGGNQQFQFDPSSSGLLGGNQQFQFNPSSSNLGGLGSNFASGGLGSGINNFNGAGLGSGINNFNGAGLGSLGLNGANGFGSAGLGGLNGLSSSTGLNGLNGFGGAGLGGLNGLSSSGLNGLSGFGGAGLGGANGLGASSGFNGFGGASQFGSQFSGQGFKQGLLGAFKIGRRGDEEQSGNKRKQQSKWRWTF